MFGEEVEDLLIKNIKDILIYGSKEKVHGTLGSLNFRDENEPNPLHCETNFL